MWNAYHFYNFDFAKMNHCLREAVAPINESLAGNMFFIRYWDGGPHMRFRIRSEVDSHPLTASLAHYWKTHGSPIILDAKDYYKSYRSQAEAEDLQVSAMLCTAGDIIPSRYEPEITRYGGEAGLAACESFFCKDSHRILKGLHTDPAQNEKLMLAYCLTAAQTLTAAGFDGTKLFNVVAHSESPSSKWLCERVDKRFAQQRNAFEALVSQFNEGVLFSDQCASLQNDIAKLLRQLQDCQTKDILLIFHSVLHMSFNRAGVPPFKENTLRYFTYLMLTAWGESGERKAG